ncbi:hypothetical protein, partial [Klebsiella pneumoniae]|uniref:hypothetical protein n=1 Tax=Klebsiella pneumoniae TaxID=573 RepID=UPI003075C95E
ELINSDKKFDGVICELFLNEAMVGGFGHKFKAPIIGFGPAMTTMWTDYMASIHLIGIHLLLDLLFCFTSG